MTPSVLPSEQTPASVIPVLTSVVSQSDVSPGTLSALQARQAEKASFFALADALKESLRPELERMANDVVQRSLQAAWAQKSGH